MKAEDYINQLNLKPHPEGGYFAEFYKSQDKVKPLNSKYKDQYRSASSSIYFLLNKGDFSAWHILKSDEIWHFYQGSALKIYLIDKKSGKLNTYTLGNPCNMEKASFQVVVESDNWFAAENIDKNSFSLIGCTVSPGFEYDDFQLAEKNSLELIYPEHKEIIKKFIIP